MPVLNFLLELLHTTFKLGFIPSNADLHRWMCDCGAHYEYIACCVDDLLVTSFDNIAIFRKLEELVHQSTSWWETTCLFLGQLD